VVSSQHPQITDGTGSETLAQTPVIKEQTLALASEMYDLIKWCHSTEELPTKID